MIKDGVVHGEVYKLSFLPIQRIKVKMDKQLNLILKLYSKSLAKDKNS